MGNNTAKTVETETFALQHKVRFVTAASLFDGHDAAIHIETVQVKGRVKRMQKRRVAGIAQILRIEFPVIVDDLTVHPKVLWSQPSKFRLINCVISPPR